MSGFPSQAKENHLKIFYLHSRSVKLFFFVKLRSYTYKMTIFLSAHTDRSGCGAAKSLFLTVWTPKIGTRVFGQNDKTLLNKSLNIYDVKHSIFCLSFPSRDRVTTPGRCEY